MLMQWFKNLFNKVPVDVTKSSGYDEPNEHFFTSKCGQLVVADCTEIIPGDIVSLGVSAQIQLPPMATDFYGRITGKFFTFFVPHRLVYGGFEDTLNGQVDNAYNPDYSLTVPLIPGAQATAAEVGLGSLADYLGFKVNPASTSNHTISNIMPFLSYHLIWQEWFRDSRLQSAAFARRNATTSGAATASAAVMPFSFVDSSSRTIANNRCTFLDGVSLWSTRQICWDKDYFTNATTLPEAGNPARVVIPLSVLADSDFDTTGQSTGTTTLSITSLFGINALQRWKQIKNISGGRFGELQYGIFGVYPESYICDRPVYLGQQSVEVYNRSIFQQTPTSPATPGPNPFSSVGAKYASPLGVGSGTLVNKRRFTEYGYLMTIFALVPSATYSSGVDRMFMRYRSGDFADPTFAGIGDQDIKTIELTSAGDYVNTFGYTQRFSEYKFKLDRVSGLLRDGGSLSSFALQRSFMSAPTLGSSFIEVPQNYLDQVAAVNGSVSTYGCWVDAGFSRKIIRKLPAYSIGTLADPKFVDTIMVNNGGQRLS